MPSNRHIWCVDLRACLRHAERRGGKKEKNKRVEFLPHSTWQGDFLPYIFRVFSRPKRPPEFLRKFPPDSGAEYNPAFMLNKGGKILRSLKYYGVWFDALRRSQDFPLKNGPSMWSRMSGKGTAAKERLLENEAISTPGSRDAHTALHGGPVFRGEIVIFQTP